MTQGGAVIIHLPGRSPRFGAQGAPADSAGAPAPPQRRTVVPAGRSPQLAAQYGNRVNLRLWPSGHEREPAPPPLAPFAIYDGFCRCRKAPELAS
jgi:hypothetical protein